MNVNKIRSICRPVRIVVGLLALVAGFFFVGEGETYNMWFLLGLAPLIAGITNFCPLCIITKKCDA